MDRIFDTETGATRLEALMDMTTTQPNLPERKRPGRKAAGESQTQYSLYSERENSKLRSLLQQYLDSQPRLSAERLAGEMEGVSGQAVRSFLRGKMGAGITMTRAMERLFRKSIDELLDRAPQRYKDTPAWDELVAQSLKLSREIPPLVYAAVGNMVPALPFHPEGRVREFMNMVEAMWRMSHISEEAMMDAHDAQVDAEMAAEDTRHSTGTFSTPKSAVSGQ